MTARRLAAIVVAAILLATLLSRLPPVRTIALTASLVPEMLGVDIAGTRDPASEPQVTTTTYGSPSDRMDVWMPSHAGPGSASPAVVLALGVHPQPIDHPDITRIARAISRLGVAVGIPDSAALRELRVTPTEPSHLADAVLVLRQWPGVQAARVGLAGFSAGASISLVAAADERIADGLRFVSAFGGYARADLLLVDVATRTAVSGATARPWQPDVGIRADVLELLIETIQDVPGREHLHELLDGVVASDAPPTGPRPEDIDELFGDEKQIYLLFTATTRVQAESAIAGFSDQLRAELAAISPLGFVDRLRAPVFLLHGEPDTAIPVEHADRLAGALGDRVGRYTRFGSFGHEQPGVSGLSAADAGDIWELSLYLRDIVAAATE